MVEGVVINVDLQITKKRRNQFYVIADSQWQTTASTTTLNMGGGQRIALCYPSLPLEGRPVVTARARHHCEAPPVGLEQPPRSGP